MTDIHTTLPACGTDILVSTWPTELPDETKCWCS